MCNFTKMQLSKRRPRVTVELAVSDQVLISKKFPETKLYFTEPFRHSFEGSSLRKESSTSPVVFGTLCKASWFGGSIPERKPEPRQGAKVKKIETRYSLCTRLKFG